MMHFITNRYADLHNCASSLSYGKKKGIDKRGSQERDGDFHWKINNMILLQYVATGFNATQWTKHYALHKYYQTLLSYALNFDLCKPESH